MNSLMQRVKARRLFLNLTQVELAATSGLSQANIAHIESGRNKVMQAKTARILANALNVPIAWLVSHNKPLAEEATMAALLEKK